MLRSLEQALAEQAARPDGDLSLLEVVALARGVDVGIEEHEQAVALILLEQLVLAGGIADDLVHDEHGDDGRNEGREGDQQVLRTRTSYHEGDRADA